MKQSKHFLFQGLRSIPLTPFCYSGFKNTTSDQFAYCFNVSTAVSWNGWYIKHNKHFHLKMLQHYLSRPSMKLRISFNNIKWDRMQFYVAWWVRFACRQCYLVQVYNPYLVCSPSGHRPLLLTCIKLNTDMDKQLHAQQSVEWIYLSILNPELCSHWSLGINE